MVALIDRGRVDIKLGGYGTASAAALVDPSMLPRVQDYRRQAAARMVALEPRDIPVRVPAAPYHVSRKVDGEFTVLVYRDGQALSINPGGTVRVGLPWMEEAAGLLSQAGIREAMVAGELYVARPDSRPRVHDVISVARQPSSPDDLRNLRFAAFDLISVEGKSLVEPLCRHLAANRADLRQGAVGPSGSGGARQRRRRHPEASSSSGWKPKERRAWWRGATRQGPSRSSCGRPRRRRHRLQRGHRRAAGHAARSAGGRDAR